MAQVYTQIQANTISNFRYRVYVNNVELAPIAADDLKLTYAPNKEMIGSSMSGETPIASINKGTKEAKLALTINGLNKHAIKTAFLGTIAQGSTATNASTPFTGALLGQSAVGRDTTFPVVAVLYFTDENGVDKLPDATDTSLPMNILLSKAVLTGGGEFVFNPTKVATYTVEFVGLADVTTDLRTFVIDDGITSGGTYTA